MWFFFLIGLIPIGFGVLLIVNGVRDRRKGAASREWPRTTGRIVSSSVRTQKVPNPGKGSPYINKFHPAIHYTYSVGNQPYQGSNYAIGYETQTLPQTNKIVERYPEGAEVQVHYNPQNPSEAVLDTGVSSGRNNLIMGIILVIFGLIFPVIGVIAAVMG